MVKKLTMGLPGTMNRLKKKKSCLNSMGHWAVKKAYLKSSKAYNTLEHITGPHNLSSNFHDNFDNNIAVYVTYPKLVLTS